MSSDDSDAEEIMQQEESSNKAGMFSSIAGINYFDDDGCPTHSSQIQIDTEEMVLNKIRETKALRADNNEEELRQHFEKTIDYVKSGLFDGLDSKYSSLDASIPWLIYWNVHSLALLANKTKDRRANWSDSSVLSPLEIKRCIATLNSCKNLVEGGYGGGPKSLSHTAPTYAAIMALISIGTNEAYESIDRVGIYRYFLSLKDSSINSFRVHKDGECDTRAVYTVLAVASILNIMTPELTHGVKDWIKTCQGFDGGIGGEPFNESHGGYAYCALASCVILNCAKETLNLSAFSKWLVNRQMSLEGGFQGRTNKLVDSCYTFWQGACFDLLHTIDGMQFIQPNGEKIQTYVMCACTHPSGGFKDKPSAGRDFYHTCYSLSGLHLLFTKQVDWPKTDCTYNVEVNKLNQAKKYFSKLKPVV